MRGLTHEELLSPVNFNKLRDALSTIGPFMREDVLIFGVHEANDAGAAQPTLNVSLSLRQNVDEESYLRCVMFDFTLASIPQVGAVDLRPVIVTGLPICFYWRKA